MTIQNPNTTLLQAAKGTPSDATPAPLAGPSSSVKFSETGVQPPSRVYVQRDDQFAISCMSSQAGETVIVRYRILLPNGAMSTNEQRIVLPTAYVANSFTNYFAAAEGWLLSVAATCLLANKRGQTFVRVGLGRNAPAFTNIIETLFADYVGSFQFIGWPEGRVSDPTESTGAFRRIAVGNPAAGLDWSLIQPQNVRWVLRGVTAVLTTAVAVANRNARLRIQADVTAINRLLPSPADQAASLAITYGTAAGFQAGSAAAAANTWGMDVPVMLDNGAGQIGSLTANIQAADQWSNIIVTLEEWLVGI